MALCLLALTGIAAFLATSHPAATTRTAAATRTLASRQNASELTVLPQAAVQVDTTPIRLIIPRIAVDAVIEARGLNAQKNLDTPMDAQEVAWYNQGPRPGVPGNAIINGHVNWWTGGAVFGRLAELRRGDEVTVVSKDGSRATFKVGTLRTLAAAARDASLFAPSKTATLTLITCAGPWDFRLGSDTDRLLVTAALV